MMTLDLMLGIAARSTYIKKEECMHMLPLDEDGGGGGVAAEIVQTTLVDFEHTIAGKMHSEILAMKNKPRFLWYKTILPEEKAEAMRIVETARRAKLSVSLTGENHPNFGKTHAEETKAKISAARVKNWRDPEYRAKMSGENHPSKRPEVRAKLSVAMNQPDVRAKISAALSGENNPMFGMTGENSPMYGKTHSEETRAKLSASWTPEKRAKLSAAMTGKVVSEETRAKMSAANIGENHYFFGKTHSEETRKKLSAKGQGISIDEWTGFSSFHPYCEKFNFKLKEKIRNRDNRTCQLCGKSELLNGERLSVHHINSSKTQGCNGEKWYLCALCRSCNSKPDTVEKEFLIVTGGGRSVQ